MLQKHLRNIIINTLLCKFLFLLVNKKWIYHFLQVIKTASFCKLTHNKLPANLNLLTRESSTLLL